MDNVQKKYDQDGELERTDNYYDIDRCSKAFFDNTEFERQYYKQLIEESEYNYCVENPEVYLMGTRDS